MHFGGVFFKNPDFGMGKNYPDSDKDKDKTGHLAQFQTHRHSSCVPKARHSKEGKTVLRSFHAISTIADQTG